jgi:hypothetical protein
VYLRDFVGDSGDRHTGVASASPDIILLTSEIQIPDTPQAMYGEGSGTENDNTLSESAVANQENYIYVRVRNRSGINATNMEATIYWAPAATLVTPNMWTLAGTTQIATVPGGDVLTVSNDPIKWIAPDAGHYCFVGLVGCPEDPAPPKPSEIQDWDHFLCYIRENNNITWRNSNVVDYSLLGPQFHPLFFRFPGAPDKARPMRLEVMSRLPKRAKVVLEGPLNLLSAMQQREVMTGSARRREVARITLTPWGNRVFAEVSLPAKSQTRLRLLVQIPTELQKHPYELAVRQLYQDQEVGRVTWRLTPKNAKR